jgi:hypothetical protein
MWRMTIRAVVAAEAASRLEPGCLCDIISRSMKRATSTLALDRLVSPLGDCLTPESARRILALKADPELQAHVDDLAARHSEGRLTPDELAEYGNFVSFSTFIAILKSKARQLLAATRNE